MDGQTAVKVPVLRPTATPDHCRRPPHRHPIPSPGPRHPPAQLIRASRVRGVPGRREGGREGGRTTARGPPGGAGWLADKRLRNGPRAHKRPEIAEWPCEDAGDCGGGEKGHWGVRQENSCSGRRPRVRPLCRSPETPDARGDGTCCPGATCTRTATTGKTGESPNALVSDRSDGASH